MPPHAGFRARLATPALAGSAIDPATMLTQRAGPVVPLGEISPLERNRLRPHRERNADEIAQVSIVFHARPHGKS
jgi:hypothetical protein